MLLGAQRKTLSGFSSTSVLPHTGYIYHSDIVQSLPPVSLSPCSLPPASRPYLAWLAIDLRLLEDEATWVRRVRVPFWSHHLTMRVVGWLEARGS